MQEVEIDSLALKLQIWTKDLAGNFASKLGLLFGNLRIEPDGNGLCGPSFFGHDTCRFI